MKMKENQTEKRGVPGTVTLANLDARSLTFWIQTRFYPELGESQAHSPHR